jgi:hypothetical protein
VIGEDINESPSDKTFVVANVKLTSKEASCMQLVFLITCLRIHVTTYYTVIQVLFIGVRKQCLSLYTRSILRDHLSRSFQ